MSNHPRIVLAGFCAAIVACRSSEARVDSAAGSLDSSAARPASVDSAPTTSSASGAAVTVQIVLTGVRSDSGKIRSVLCSKEERFPNRCALRDSVAAKKGAVVVAFRNVPAGRYAFAAFHDANGDGRVGISPMGFPTEGLAYSNDAMGQAGPPAWEQSAFDASKNAKITARMRYW